MRRRCRRCRREWKSGGGRRRGRRVRRSDTGRMRRVEPSGRRRRRLTVEHSKFVVHFLLRGMGGLLFFLSGDIA